MFFDRYCKGIRNGWESTPRVRIEVQDHFDITAKGLSERCAIARTTFYRFFQGHLRPAGSSRAIPLRGARALSPPDER